MVSKLYHQRMLDSWKSRKGVHFNIRAIVFPLSLVVTLAVWEVGVGIFSIPSFLLPPPSMIAQVMVEEWPSLLSHTAWTLVGTLVGYSIANVIGLSLAIFLLYIGWLEPVVSPWAVMVKNVPFVAIASILYIVMGDSPLSIMVLVVLATFFPIYANVRTGLENVESVLLDRMNVLRASRWQVFRYVRWPNALPYYFTAHRIAFTSAVIVTIVAEWLVGSRGLGYLLVNAMTQYRADRLWAVTVISLVIAAGVLWVVNIAEQYTIRWKRA